MRYISKKEMPECLKDPKYFLEYKWKNFKRSSCGKIVKENILNEQQWLCAYCEIKVDLKDSHIEHIKPKSNPKYEKLKFDYNNLIVSCNGKECRVDDEEYDEDIHSCGHKKDNDFDENKFLDPTKIPDISDYFEYDKYNGAIKASNKDKEKAKYMINLLNLNNVSLNKMRLNTVIAIQKSFKNSKIKIDIEIFREKLLKLVSSNNPPAFVSFIRYYYGI